MQILRDEINKKVQINLDSREFVITNGNEDYKYGLAHRIDMSYKGKPDQCSTPFWYFDEEDYEKLKGMFDEFYF